MAQQISMTLLINKTKLYTEKNIFETAVAAEQKKLLNSKAHFILCNHFNSISGNIN